jgi:hypothetical protein
VGVINLKTHVHVVKLPQNHASGLRFHFKELREPRGTRRDLEFHKKWFFGISIVKLLEKNKSDVRFGFFGTYWMLGN